jgi:hypothetical protein
MGNHRTTSLGHLLLSGGSGLGIPKVHEIEPYFGLYGGFGSSPSRRTHAVWRRGTSSWWIRHPRSVPTRATMLVWIELARYRRRHTGRRDTTKPSRTNSRLSGTVAPSHSVLSPNYVLKPRHYCHSTSTSEQSVCWLDHPPLG